MALAFTESGLNYNAKHKNNEAKGICGIVPKYWNDVLKEHHVKINSLNACLVVYKELLNKHKNKRLALKEYKGVTSKSNLYLIDKVIETEKGLK